MASDQPAAVSVAPEIFEANVKSIRERVAQIEFCRFIGSQLDELAPGICVASVAHRPELLQYMGMFHGGVTAYLIDHATTVAAATVVEPGQHVLTAEYKLSLMAPAVGERLICRARVLRRGRTMTVVEAGVFCLNKGEEKQTAAALATIAVIDGDRAH